MLNLIGLFPKDGGKDIAVLVRIRKYNNARSFFCRKKGLTWLRGWGCCDICKWQCFSGAGGDFVPDSCDVKGRLNIFIVLVHNAWNYNYSL